MALNIDELHRFTTDEYEQMALAGALPARGVELLDGFVVEMTPKGNRHSWAVVSLTESFVLASRGRYLVYPEALSLRVGLHDMPEPDLALARLPRDYSRERPRPDELALVVEVADTSLRRDLGVKRARYATFGIAEYWVVDLDGGVIHVSHAPERATSTYRNERTAGAGEVLAPQEYADAQIEVARLFPAER